MYKPGWQTTEFWLTFGISIIAVLVALGVVRPDERETTEGWWTNTVSTVALLVTQASIAWRYIESRQAAKSIVPVQTSGPRL